jgi:hypothetical protein
MNALNGILASGNLWWQPLQWLFKLLVNSQAAVLGFLVMAV